MNETIVCGVADGEAGPEAALHAAELGERLDLRLVLVNVVDVAGPARESLTARQQQDGAARLLRDLAAKIGGDVEFRVELGDAAETLAQIAAEEDAALVVLGSRTAGLTGRALRCRLAARLSASTPVPVLVAPPAKRRRPAEPLPSALSV